MIKKTIPHTSLIEWFLKNKRVFSWREERSPYRVWIAETMLQQTRAEVVADYFIRWVEKFPDIYALYRAKEDDVIKMWEGLGYYARARNLHKAAKVLVNTFQGKMPDCRETLLTIPGIGLYTAGAILSFAFHKRASALDANVSRVLARWLGYEKDVVRHKKELSDLLYTLLPKDDASVAMEALIELGAVVCKKTPLCDQCPLQKNCASFQTNTQEQFPKKPPRKNTEILHRSVFCIEHERHFLLQKGKKGQIMESLWEFPYFLCEKDPNLCLELEKSPFQEKVIPIEPLYTQVHTFTRYKVFLYPILCKAKKVFNLPSLQWVSEKQLGTHPFSSGHRKILYHLQEKHF